MHKRHTQRKGFTLVELMVAVSILGIMLFLINELFQTTSAAVTTSVQQSKSVAGTRLIGEQIQSDTDAMLGPDDRRGASGGYLVIIQRRVLNVPLQNTTNLAEFTTPFIRSDQLVFIRNAGGLRSMTPQDADSFRSNLVGKSDDYAKVWYGHPQRLNNDGSIPGNTANFQLGGADAGFDRIGSDWILGRQALLFNPTDAFEESRPTPRANPTVAGQPNSYIFARDAYSGSRVFNSTYSRETRIINNGLTDVTIQSYFNPADPNALVSQLTNPALPNEAERNRLYLNTAYYLRNFPLRVNTSPTDTNFASWSVAQTHGILAPNCSDFVVQFAADLNGNGRLDTTANNGSDLGGDIRWYDGFNTNPGPANWNTGWQDIDTSRPGRAQPFVRIDNDTRAFIFRLDDYRALDPVATGLPPIAERQQRSMWPYLLRIRYRLHGNRGRLAGNDPSALVDGIDNDGDQGQPGGGVDEPGEDQIPGQWFEHIIRVPRP